MSFHILKSEVRPLTPQLAVEHLNTEPSPTERELNATRVKFLTERFTGGLTVPFHWATAQLGDTIYRMNGQHSAKALSSLNGNFPEGAFVHFDQFKVDSKDDLALLFRQFDSRQSGRMPGDVAGAYQGLYDDIADVDKPVAKIALEGVAWYRKTVEAVPVPAGDDVYTLFGEQALHDFLHFAKEVFSIKTPEMKRVPVAAAMYHTFGLSQADARKFWLDVARGGTTQDDDPATVLDTWLKSIKEEPERYKKSVKPGNFYQGSIFAWNAAREHKVLTSIRHDARKGFLKAI